MQPGSCTGPGWCEEPGLSWPPPQSRTASERPLDWGWWGRRPGRRDSRSAGTRPLVCWWLLASLSPEIINPIICFSTDHWHHQQHNYIFSLNTDRYYDRNCTHFFIPFLGHREHNAISSEFIAIRVQWFSPCAYSISCSSFPRSSELHPVIALNV